MPAESWKNSLDIIGKYMLTTVQLRPGTAAGEEAQTSAWRQAMYEIGRAPTGCEQGLHVVDEGF